MLRWILAVLVLACGTVTAGCGDGDDVSGAATADTGNATQHARPEPTRDRSLCDVADLFCVSAQALESAEVVKIIDGDTLDVMIEGRQERVRIFGIDTPERGERCFTESSRVLEALSGVRIRLRADIRERDRGGRLLRYVYTDDGVSIDAMMISEGMAYAWTRDGAMLNELIAVEARAREHRRGCLWGS